MSKRLTYEQVERFVGLYTTEGSAACCKEFDMTPLETSREASLLNIQEHREFTQKELDLITKYHATLGKSMVLLLPDRLPSDFASAPNA